VRGADPGAGTTDHQPGDRDAGNGDASGRYGAPGPAEGPSAGTIRLQLTVWEQLL